jgi:hypothetical protein
MNTQPELDQPDSEELIDQKGKLSERKMEIQSRLNQINTRCKQRLATSEFVKIQSERQQLVAEMSTIEGGLIGVKNQLRIDADRKFAMREGHTPDVRITRQIVAVRDKYFDLVSEPSTGNSERLFAAQIVRELNPIIKQLVDA